MTLANCACGPNTDVFFMLDDCVCPGEAPALPAKFKKLRSANLDITELRETIESENSRGLESCSYSVQNGAEYSPGFDFDFIDHVPLWQGVLGAQPRPQATTGAATIDVVGNDTLSTADVDFWTLGFRPGMLIELAGFTDPANASDPLVSGADRPRYWLVDIVTEPGVVPSQLTVCVEADGLFMPDLVAEAGTGDEEISMLAETFVGSNREVYAYFQRAFFDQNLFQLMSGSLLSSFSMTLTPNRILTAEISAQATTFDNANASFLGTRQTLSEDCAGALWNAKIGNVRVMYGCTPVCVTEVSLEVNRNPNSEVASCGTLVSSGTYEVSGNLTILLGEGLYPAQFLDDVRNQTSDSLMMQIWEPDFQRMQYISLPNVILTANDVSAPDGECAKQQIQFKGQIDGGIASQILVGRNYKVPEIVRNRVDLCTTCPTLSIYSAATGANTRQYDWGDGNVTTGAAAPTETQTHTYTDTLANHTVGVYDEDDTPWTSLSINNACLTQVRLCALKNLQKLSLQGNNLTDLDVSYLPSLVVLDASGNPDLACVDVEGTFQLLTINLADTGLAAYCIEELLDALIESGQPGGTLDISGGTSAEPTAAALVAIATLQANGWTVVHN